jgi:cytochrome c oxidase subunit I+III
MVASRRFNARGQAAALRAALPAGALLAALGAAALVYAPYATGLDPTRHAYPAIVWVLVLWTAAHVALGILMQLYCVARSFAGRLTRDHDIDLHNVVLYWHFAAVTAAVTVAIIALFPLLARG